MINCNKCATCQFQYTPKEISFPELLNQYDKILIPKIQRDYAQGRTDTKAKDVRKILLDDIFSGKEVKFDFIFGTKQERKEGSNKYNCFIPLDGQQRLTTLFLLYLYGMKTKKISDKIELSKFSYDTRRASLDFCNELVSDVNHWDVLLNQILSEQIKNSTWFLDYWQYDPTVASMLTMLDDIHRKAKDTSDYPILENIKFYFFDMDEHNLNENLYLKMNSRGKPLTAFENFKAAVDKILPINFSIDIDPFEEIDTKDEYLNKLENFKKKWQYCIDKHWMEFFWKFNEDYLIDAPFIRFVSNFLLSYWIINVKESKIQQTGEYILGTEGESPTNERIENSFIFEQLLTINGKESYIQFEVFKDVFVFNKALPLLAKVLNGFLSHFDSISKYMLPSWENSSSWNIKMSDLIVNNKVENWIFKENVTIPRRVVLLGISLYLEKNSFDETGFMHWMRFVWNIAVDPNLRNNNAMISAMKFIDKHSDMSSNIIESLDKLQLTSKEKYNVYEFQFEEEIIKAKLLMKNDSFEPAIFEAESQKIFKGNIRLLLTDNDNTTFEDFVINKNAADKLFKDNDLIDKAENYFWIRALLAKSTNEELDKSKHLFLNGNFDNWRYLINGPFIGAMRNLIKEIANSNKKTDEVLTDICVNYERIDNISWVYPLVNWVGKDGETLLGNFTDSRLIQSYGNQMWLYKTGSNFTEGNILLSNFRNEIVKEIITNSDDNKFERLEGAIQKTFFRGWNNLLIRKVKIKNKEFKFVYFFDRQIVRVGIKNTEDMSNSELSIILSELSKNDYGERVEGWICQKTFDYQNDVRQEIDINNFIEKIETEVFDNYNPNSLISKITANLIKTD